MAHMVKNALLAAVWFSAGLLTAIGISSHADPYIVVGVGKGELTHPGANKWWVQEGWNYTIDQKSTVWNIGAGWKINKYLAAEVNYHDLGDYHHFAGFMVNEDLYDPTSPTLCSGPCDPTQWGYLKGNVTGWSVSILPRLPLTKDISLFARYGLSTLAAKFTAFIAPSDTTSKNYSEVNFSQRIKSEIIGLGITYKNFSLEHQRIPTLVAKKGGCCSAYTSGENYTVSYRWSFD